MSRSLHVSLLSLAFSLLTAAAACAETKVTVSETHLCCGQCLRGVVAALKDVQGVTHKSSQEAKTIELVAENDAAAQSAVDALAAAGFYGKLDSQTIKYKTVPAPTGTVEKVEVSGVHNCCGACTTAIKKAVSTVSGVTANSIKNKDSSFTIEGKFQATEILDALLKAGFYAQVK